MHLFHASPLIKQDETYLLTGCECNRYAFFLHRLHLLITRLFTCYCKLVPLLFVCSETCSSGQVADLLAAILSSDTWGLLPPSSGACSRGGNIYNRSEKHQRSAPRMTPTHSSHLNNEPYWWKLPAMSPKAPRGGRLSELIPPVTAGCCV